MRILLINTPYPFGELPLPPLGLTYLAAVLEREGVDIHILDLLVAQHSPERLKRRLKEYQPQAVGVSCSTMNYPAASRILKICKSFDSGLATLIGGPHVSFMASEVLQEAPWIDIVVRGEGEETLVELVNTLAAGTDLGQVPGIAFRRDGELVLTQPRPLIKELDRLPLPARHLLPLSKYRALRSHCSVVTSRGCSFGCLFCSAPQMFGRRVRFRNPKLVVEEMEIIHRDLGFEEINVVDDTFTLNARHVQDICGELIARKVNVKWSVYSRVDTASRHLFTAMKEAGCTWVCFGIESGSQEILNNIKKKITPVQAEAAVVMAKEAGINVLNSFIIGLPGETPETARQTVEFGAGLFERYDASYGLHILAPLPGTEVYHKASQFGIRILTKNWARFDANLPVAETANLSAGEMKEIVDHYEREAAKAWQKMQSEVEAGDPLQKERVDKSVTQGFVWKLLKGDIIERVGHSGCHLEELARRVSHRLTIPLSLAEQELSRQVRDGNLTCVAEGAGGETPVWEWT
jgi:radical SAM superfamily enzyme YgiQ (UPF0313 family)